MKISRKIKSAEDLSALDPIVADPTVDNVTDPVADCCSDKKCEAIQDIQSAIDKLGQYAAIDNSAESELAKDAIANLAVVLFELK